MKLLRSRKLNRTKYAFDSVTRLEYLYRFVEVFAQEGPVADM